MIDLFDAARLAPRRDVSAAIAGAALAAVVAGVGGYALLLQQRLQAVQLEQAGLQARLSRAERDAGAAQAPSAALLADLQRQAEALEAEAGGEAPAGADAAHPAGSSAAALAGNPRASQWLDRLDGLAAADLSLQKIDIDRAGALRIEGLARSPQAVSSLLQAWDRQQLARSPVPARAIDLREDKDAASQLRFVLRAAAPAAKTAPERAAAGATRDAAAAAAIGSRS